MKYWFPVLALLLIGCESSNRDFFDQYSDKKVVHFHLKKFKLDSIPPSIGKLRKVETLIITQDSSGGWTVYPPLSAMRSRTFNPPFKYLPNEISSLATLRSLSLLDLNLGKLPDNFGMLTLDTLSLQMNKLTLANELDKLAQMKTLKYLDFTGNRVDSTSLQTLQKVNPSLTIIF